MKNIQVIDGAVNCAYDIFAATDEEFAPSSPLGRTSPSSTTCMHAGRLHCSTNASHASGTNRR